MVWNKQKKLNPPHARINNRKIDYNNVELNIFHRSNYILIFFM
jgi:hypothetical protein